jgi:hypothetical protein
MNTLLCQNEFVTTYLAGRPTDSLRLNGRDGDGIDDVRNGTSAA